MNLEKHCVSLEIAKKLKEAGWEKETGFSWYEFISSVDKEIKISLTGTEPHWTVNDKTLGKYFAPLATEILEELPREVSIKQLPDDDSVRYQVGHNADRMAFRTFRYNNNLCDALAEMWLYLKKENLL